METEEEEKHISIDDAISYIGEFKNYQWILSAMFCTVMFPCTFPILIMVFAAQDPEWRCASNSTMCKENGTFTSRNLARCSLPRKEWEYTQPKEYSIVTTYDIYCDDSWLIQLSTSVLFIGWCIGGLVVGWAADNYGRKNVIFSSIFMVLLCGIVTPCMPNIETFIVLRFLIGISIAGTNTQMSILLSEIVSFRYRPHASLIVWIFFSVVLCVLSLKAYLISNWKTLFLVCTVPYVFILSFYMFSPESPRWLRLKGKHNELHQLLDEIARVNKKKLPQNVRILNVVKGLKTRKSNPLELFTTLKLTKITLILGYGTLVHGMVYYGFSMAASALGGSLYFTFFLLSVVEIPASTSAIFICKKFGRKYPTICGISAASISSLILAFLPMKFAVARIMVGILGKLSIAVSFQTITIWGIELFPTVIRGQGMGFATVSSRIGAGCAPWVVTGLGSLQPSAPYIFMSFAALSCSIILNFLFDTKDMATIEEIEDYEKHIKHEEEGKETHEVDSLSV